MRQSDLVLEQRPGEFESRRYQLRLVAILAATIGVANLDMFGIGILMPFIQPQLHLSDTQIGVILSGFWVTFACSSFVIGPIVDRLGKRRTILAVFLLAFSVCSVAPAIAASFVALFAARLLMGVLDGPIYVLPQAITALQSPAERCGLNLGIVQNVGSSVVGAVMAPVLVYLAVHFSWRAGFLAGVLPALVCAVSIRLNIREGDTGCARDAAVSEPRDGVRHRWRWPRNLWLCALISCLVMVFVTTTLGFVPLFLTSVRHLTDAQMSVLMSVLGISLLVLGVALPGISDRVGRKPVVFASGLLGLALPLGALCATGSLWASSLLFFLGWALAGASSLTFATIVVESVSSERVATSIGVISAIGMLIGGVLGPALAGWCADRWGLRSILVMTTVCCLAISAASLALRESAPRRMGSRASG